MLISRVCLLQVKALHKLKAVSEMLRKNPVSCVQWRGSVVCCMSPVYLCTYAIVGRDHTSVCVCVCVLCVCVCVCASW